MSQPSIPPSLPGGETVEEIIVRSKSLNRLQIERFRAETVFYNAFNALNTDHEFDIHCGHLDSAPSRISLRVCRANFVSTLRAQETEARLRGDPPPPTNDLMIEKARLLKDQLRSLVTQSPELATALLSYESARKAFETELARRCGGRILFCRRH